MSSPAVTPGAFVLGKRPLRDRVGDWILHGLTGAAALGALVLVGLLVYELFRQAWPAITRYGFGFIPSHALPGQPAIRRRRTTSRFWARCWVTRR